MSYSKPLTAALLIISMSLPGFAGSPTPDFAASSTPGYAVPPPTPPVVPTAKCINYDTGACPDGSGRLCCWLIYSDGAKENVGPVSDAIECSNKCMNTSALPSSAIIP